MPLSEEELLSRFEPPPRRSGKEWRAHCPVHDDRNPSLTISRGEYKWFLTCRSQGCSERDIVEAIGLKPSDLNFHERMSSQAGLEIVHPYCDEHGDVLFEVTRTGTGSAKKIRYRHREPSNREKWVWNVRGVRRVPYRLPELLASPPSDPVLIVEGEKNADDVRRIGLTATTNPGGAGKWRTEFNQYLKGHPVIVIPDNDDEGRKHAEAVARQLSRVAESVKVLILPGLQAKGDISDWIQAGGKRDELERLIEAAPRYAFSASANGADEQSEPDGTKRGPSPAQVLVDLAEESCEFFSVPRDNRAAYATFPWKGHHETCRIESHRFAGFLGDLYAQHEGRWPTQSMLKEALATLDMKVALHAAERELHIRVAEHEGALYLDLASSAWQVVRINRDGWEIIDSRQAPVRFERSNTMLALPAPVAGGSVEGLRSFLNARRDEDWRLMLTWLLFAFQPRGPFPVLTIQGEQGSAKSTTSRVLRNMIDPSELELRTIPKNEEDFMVGARRSWILAYDNLSGLQAWLSDALCRVASGTSFGTRKHHTNTEEVFMRATRAVMVNGIDDMTTRSDLGRRAVAIDLPSIPEADRRQEWTFWRDFEEARPRLLGALCGTLARVLALRPGIQVAGGMSSMGDFETFGVAVEQAMGWPPGSFLRPYRERVGQSVSSALEGDPVAIAVKAFAIDQGRSKRVPGAVIWTGAAHELLPLLECCLPGMPAVHDENTRAAVIGRWGRQWPTSAARLGKVLKRLAPALRAEARIDVQQERTSDQRVITIKRVAFVVPGVQQPPAVPSLPSPLCKPAQVQLNPNDGRPGERPGSDTTPSNSVTGHDGRLTGQGLPHVPTGSDGSDGNDGADLSEDQKVEGKEVLDSTTLPGHTDSATGGEDEQ